MIVPCIEMAMKCVCLGWEKVLVCIHFLPATYICRPWQHRRTAQLILEYVERGCLNVNCSVFTWIVQMDLKYITPRYSREWDHGNPKLHHIK